MLSLIKINQSVLVACLVAIINQFVSALPTLENVCANSQLDFTVGWSNVGEVRDLLNQFDANRQVCDQKFHSSFEALKNVLDEQLLSDVCGQAMYNAIRKYHETFISVFVADVDIEQLKDRMKGETLPIPRALYDFFVVFAESISAQCKKNLMERLNLDDRITEDDYKMIAALDKHYQKPKSFDDISVHVDGKKKLNIQADPNSPLVKIKETCDRKFGPIYQELLMPVIRLNNLGYWDKLDSCVENFKMGWNNNYNRWLSIVQICETMSHVRITKVEGKKASIVAESDMGTEVDTVELEMIPIEHSKVKLDALITAKATERLYLVDRFKKKISRMIVGALIPNPFSKIHFPNWGRKEDERLVAFVDCHKGGAIVSALLKSV